MVIYQTSLINDPSLFFYTTGYAHATTYGAVTTVTTELFNYLSATWNASNYLFTTLRSAIGTSDLTMGAWLNMPTPSSLDYTPTLMSIGDVNPRGYIVIEKTTGYANFYNYDGSFINTSGTTAVCDGNWHHICAVRSGTLHTIYVDGVDCGNATGTAKNYSNTNFWLGRSSNGTNDLLNVSAFIADWFMFKRALTQREISLLASYYRDGDVRNSRRQRLIGSVAGRSYLRT